jgi:hypothetical protein
MSNLEPVRDTDEDWFVYAILPYERLCDEAADTITELRSELAACQQRNLSLEVFAPQIDKLEDVEKQLADMTAERDGWMAAAMGKESVWVSLIAASQAYSQQLRNALEMARNGIAWYIENIIEADGCDDEALQQIDAALVLPHDDTALKQWGAKLLRDVGAKYLLISQMQLNRRADELEAGK